MTNYEVIYLTTFKILSGDITKLKFDAIVNAANTSLLGGGGVDGAIHKACGERLLDECRELKGCRTGQAKLTRSYNLGQLGIYWIIHTVGPIYRKLGSEEKYLRKAYRSCLELAADYADNYTEQIDKIIHTNIYRFNTAGFIGSRKAEHIENDCRDYVAEHPIKTIAFPSISTGAYSYPLKEACEIALEEIFKFITEYPDKLDEIAMVCLDNKTYDMFETIYNEKYINQNEKHGQ